MAWLALSMYQNASHVVCPPMQWTRWYRCSWWEPNPPSHSIAEGEWRFFTRNFGADVGAKICWKLYSTPENLWLSYDCFNSKHAICVYAQCWNDAKQKAPPNKWKESTVGQIKSDKPRPPEWTWNTETIHATRSVFRIVEIWGEGQPYDAARCTVRGSCRTKGPGSKALSLSRGDRHGLGALLPRGNHQEGWKSREWNCSWARKWLAKADPSTGTVSSLLNCCNLPNMGIVMTNQVMKCGRPDRLESKGMASDHAAKCICQMQVVCFYSVPFSNH